MLVDLKEDNSSIFELKDMEMISESSSSASSFKKRRAPRGDATKDELDGGYWGSHDSSSRDVNSPRRTRNFQSAPSTPSVNLINESSSSKSSPSKIVSVTEKEEIVAIKLDTPSALASIAQNTPEPKKRGRPRKSPSIKIVNSVDVQTGLSQIVSKQEENDAEDKENDSKIVNSPKEGSSFNAPSFSNSVEESTTVAPLSQRRKKKSKDLKESMEEENEKKHGVSTKWNEVEKPKSEKKEEKKSIDQHSPEDKLLLHLKNPPKELSQNWSEAERQAWDSRSSKPNGFYYRHNAFLSPKKKGAWSEDEKKLFISELERHGASDKWGLLSENIPGRVGFQCATFFRHLVAIGEIKDPKYTVQGGQTKYINKGKGSAHITPPVILNSSDGYSSSENSAKSDLNEVKNVSKKRHRDQKEIANAKSKLEEKKAKVEVKNETTSTSTSPASGAPKQFKQNSLLSFFTVDPNGTKTFLIPEDKKKLALKNFKPKEKVNKSPTKGETKTEELEKQLSKEDLVKAELKKERRRLARLKKKEEKRLLEKQRKKIEKENQKKAEKESQKIQKEKEKEIRDKRDEADIRGIEIVTGIYLGGRDAAKNKTFIDQANIKSIVNISKKKNTMEDVGIDTKHYKLEDNGELANLNSKREEFIQYVQEARSQERNVLIHCELGRSRSVSFIIMWLLHSGWTLADAYAHMSKKQPEIAVNDGFKKQLMDIEVMMSGINTIDFFARTRGLNRSSSSVGSRPSSQHSSQDKRLEDSSQNSEEILSPNTIKLVETVAEAINEELQVKPSFRQPDFEGQDLVATHFEVPSIDTFLDLSQDAHLSNIEITPMFDEMPEISYSGDAWAVKE
eukprot:TRINITY_DN8732_c0_g1_i1.p1 TRINITY_DN8732_c0_g1~~TRINITY_DN8732_c0_g1_i1.p1  ORF type:complete len:847 (+),score=249.88 TRINITY_DN8732_c0_g1_i1:122-2662(+)